MKVLSEKRMELSQTIASLSGSIRMEKGCNRFEEWDAQENLMNDCT
jgi:hypothetical protein